MKQGGWRRCADSRRVGATIGAGLRARLRLQTKHAGMDKIPATAPTTRSLARTADPPACAVPVGSARRTDRRWPE